MKWKERMPAIVREKEFPEYATATENRPVIIDCSLGTNPSGPPDLSASIPGNRVKPDTAAYPGGDLKLKKAISDSWRRMVEPEEIILGTGSIGLIVTIARTFCSTDSRVLGITPQFPDGPMHFQFSGASYSSIKLSPPLYEISIPNIISAMRGDESIVYLDRPHNPTGQASTLGEMTMLAEACEKQGSILLVDEAYGDFLLPDESSATLRSKALIVLRSFSKGPGLAGIRTGYAVVRDPEACRFIRKTAPPFTVSSISIEMAAASLVDSGFVNRSRNNVRSVKRRLMDEIKIVPFLSASATHPDVPIFLLSSKNGGENLYERFMNYGIRTEPGTCFENLGPESVRLRVPAPEEYEVFVKQFRAAVEQ
ncbi:MAG: aminotransferase class I/II-fold pyridoxal phosphate-dependent enzyme [Synergistota bacterium]|nr:aminotransferase class I/II-fold pyridoxal phosphate-dependent enzyme [Synergistota bacterium]